MAYANAPRCGILLTRLQRAGKQGGRWQGRWQFKRADQKIIWQMREDFFKKTQLTKTKMGNRKTTSISRPLAAAGQCDTGCQNESDNDNWAASSGQQQQRRGGKKMTQELLGFPCAAKSLIKRSKCEKEISLLFFSAFLSPRAHTLSLSLYLIPASPCPSYSHSWAKSKK